VALTENPNDEGQENDRPLEHIESINVARESSNEAEVISEHEGINYSSVNIYV